MRQAFLSVPRALEEVALVEGVSRLRIWWHVMLPLVRPSLATLAVFSFVAVWGDFLWPLVLLDDPQHYTLPLGVNRLLNAFSLDWRWVAAGAVLSLLPVLLVFAFSQRFFIEGALKGAILKGIALSLLVLLCAAPALGAITTTIDMLDPSDGVSLAPKITVEDAHVAWSEPAEAVEEPSTP